MTRRDWYAERAHRSHVSASRFRKCRSYGNYCANTTRRIIAAVMGK